MNSKTTFDPVSAAVDPVLTIDALNKRIERLETLFVANIKSVLNTEEAAALLGITKERLRVIASRREIPHFKRGQRDFFLRSEIEKWQTGRRVLTNEELRSQADTYVAIKNLEALGAL